MKGKGSVMLLIIWLKWFISSHSTGPQSHSHLHHSWILSALMCRASEGSFLNLEATAQVPLQAPPQKVGGSARPPNTREPQTMSHALT